MTLCRNSGCIRSETGQLENSDSLRFLAAFAPRMPVCIPHSASECKHSSSSCSIHPAALSALGQALDRLVTVSSTRYRASTSALSTLSFFRMGYLILRGASRLDAFSVYPFPTWLPGGASGDAAGTPAVSPSRSSRTKDSSSQISCAHAG